MAMTIEAALQLEVFSRVSVEVFAGRRNFDRLVRWVHPTEVNDIAHFLSGGEMLLTAGLGIGTTEEQQTQYIHEIDDAHAAVLIVELSGRAFDTMPHALIEAARERDFPLVGLGAELPFVEVSAQVHESMIDHASGCSSRVARG